MITLHSMEWSNWFSYGDDNRIDFDKSNVTQIIGTNGSGKSSIMLILQEMLYGKNSSGVKKGNIRNRYTEGKLSGRLTFSKGDDFYEIAITRGSGIKISLKHNGDDISQHTSANTYKTIESIIGIDFKTFEQIVYQSSVSSLQFLTATDTNRKAFLIGLLNLTEYLDLHEKFKSIHKDVSSKVASLSGEVSATKKWIDGYSEGEKVSLVPVPDIDDTLNDTLIQLSADQKNVEGKNAIIAKNVLAKQNLAKLDPSNGDPIGDKPYDAKDEQDEVSKLNAQRWVYVKELEGIDKLPGSCPTCYQDITEDIKISMCADRRKKVKDIELRIGELEKTVQDASLNIKHWETRKKEYDKYVKAKDAVDDSISDELIDIDQLKDEIADLRLKIAATERAHKDALLHNSAAEATNKKIEEDIEKLGKQKDFLESSQKELDELNSVVGKLELLKNIFSTKGLITYKIEYMIKDLENLINKYLGELSDGRFQLYFKLNGDKLNVDIDDNGTTIDISALSMGERSRVNSATLLSIRAIMANLSDTKINLLFLDEILGTLDNFGKERLIELLLQEHELNTFLVSHEYTHPLLDKLTVSKTDNISRIDYG